jgi:CRISPR-associated protein Csb2
VTYLCISVHWLDGRYHGLLDRDGPPEWPPSPFRLFQALMAGIARREDIEGGMGKSLRWLTSEPPVIISPQTRRGQVVTRYVPNNDSDRVLNRQGRLTGKTSEPTIMLGAAVVHYVWPIRGDSPEVETLISASHCLSCLGWGIDMAYADGQILDEGEIGMLSGIRWYPKPNTLRDDGMLRVPKEGSVADLCDAHQSALRRIEHGKPLRTVDKPRVFDRVFYTSAERPLGRPCVIFALRCGDDAYRYPQAKLIHIAGMTRCAAIKAMKAYPPANTNGGWVEAFVAGHRPDGADSHEQFSYIPLPSIGHQHADGMIRRVMLAAPFGHEEELGHLADQLDGGRLQPEGDGARPTLSRQRPDGVTRRYVDPSRVWASVTPVILPGHDDHKPAKTVKLIERALRQSGIDQRCEFTWSAVPNFESCLTAHKYDRDKRHVGYYRPDHLAGLTAVHIRLTFEHPVAGPLSMGSGRHCGLGVLAALI